MKLILIWKLKAHPEIRVFYLTIFKDPVLAERIFAITIFQHNKIKRPNIQQIEQSYQQYLAKKCDISGNYCINFVATIIVNYTRSSPSVVTVPIDSGFLSKY